MKKAIILFIAIILTLSTAKTYAQKLIKSDITKIIRTVNRNISIEPNTKNPVLHIDANKGAGIAWLKLPKLKNADIELEIKGSGLVQQSFVGIAFRGQNDTTYEAIYFRPFNFKAKEELKRKHSVQYISLPDNDWPKLRASFPLKYEQGIEQDLDPNNWFKVRLTIKDKIIQVYVNADSKPCLEVESLGNLPAGRIGLWVGNNAPGDFKNLKITTN